MISSTIHNANYPTRFGLIIGAAKCGTTSLFNYLREHPQICPSRIKEPEFFVNQSKWGQGLEAYFRLWNWDSSTHRIAMEASTSYTKMPRFRHASDRIATVPGEFRFVYLVRNPFERIESHFTHAFHEPSWNTPKDVEEMLPYLIDVSRYAYQLEFFEAQFGAESLLVLTNEALSRHPASVLTQVCTHFGIDDVLDVPERPLRHNANRDRIANPYVTRLVRHPLTKWLLTPLPLNFRRKLPHLLGLTRRTENQRLSPKQRDRVLRELAPDIGLLKAGYGIETERWGFG